MSEPNESEKPKVPQWATAPFRRFLEQTQHLEQTLHLSIKGISGLRGMPGLVEALADLDEDMPGEEESREIEIAKKEAELAHREVDSGFPLLHSHATVALWSYLEALFRTFVSEILRNYPGAMTKDEVGKIKIRLGEYESLADEEKYLYVFNLLEQEKGFHLASGVTRFEALLAPFGFAGKVPDRVCKDIFELGQIRNAILHCGGIADVRLVNSCPWLDLEVGDQISLGQTEYRRYFSAVHDYALLLINRIGEHYGKNMEEYALSNSDME
jgi:hypothetical protein